MTRFSVAVLFGVVLSASSLFAQRVEFGPGKSAGVSSRILVSRNAAIPEISLELDVPFVDLNEAEDGFQEVKVQGLVPNTDLGAPQLPQAGALIAVPEGFQPELTVESIETRKLPGILVKPSQRKWRCGGPKTPFLFNSQLYRSQATYPQRLVVLEEAGKLGNVRLMRVGFKPLRMHFGEKALEVATHTKVRVRLNAKANAVPTQLPRSIYQLLRQNTVNGQALQGLVRQSAGPEVMAIFVADALKSSMAPFIEWKETKGIKTQVFTLTEMGGTKEAMQTFIKKYYETASVKPSYFLFVGNKTSLPAFKESTGSGSAASDYRMALLAGEDEIPDVFYGRFAVDNETELTTMIRRSIAYEKMPAAEAWYHDATTIASRDGSDPSDVEYAGMVLEALKRGTYQTVDTFKEGDETATAANISESINAGRSWIAYFGHGTGTAWGSTNDSFSNNEVRKLTNNGKLPILVDVACLNAAWMSSSTCFGKAWMTHQKDGIDSGAVAYYGGSVSISWDPPAVMSVGIAKSHFEQKLETMGASVAAGQLHLIAQMGSNSDTIDNLKWFNLFADPSLFVRTDAPKAYTITMNTDTTGAIGIQAVDAEGKAFANLVTTLSHPNRGVLSTGRTDTNGFAMLASTGSTWEPGTVLTVSGYNAETQTLTLQ